VDAEGMGCDGNIAIEVIRQARQHGLDTDEFRRQCRPRGDVGRSHLERRRPTRGSQIETGHRETGIAEQAGCEETDLAEPEDGDTLERHEGEA